MRPVEGREMEGLDLSPATLATGLLVSSVGFGLFLYGKRATRFPQLLTGLTLMVYPLFVHGALAMLAVGAVLVGGMWVWVRTGA
jgi:hypothetical protein